MPDPDAKRLLMGRIGAAHGIKGEVRIQSFTEDPLALVDYREFSTNRPGLTIIVERARATTNVLVARLKGVDDRNAAEKLNGVELYVERERLPGIAEDDDYYLADLIGLEARGLDGEVLGKVLAVPNFGAGDILEIGGTGRETQLIPSYSGAAVPEIEARRGLCRRRSAGGDRRGGRKQGARGGETLVSWRADVITLFPELFPGPLGASVIGRGLGDQALVAAHHAICATSPSTNTKPSTTRRPAAARAWC